MSTLLSIRGGKSPRPSSRPARLMLAALGGFVLVGLWLSIVARTQDNAQASSPLEPCSTGPAIVAGAHSSTGTLPNHVITAASDPLCTNADLTVAKTVNNTIPDVGKAITYTVMVTNAGPDDASGVQLTDVLPESAIFRSATPQDVCTEEDNTVTCDLGHLPNGDSALVTIVVTPTQAGTITNMASVTSDASDPDQSNNTAERTNRVTGADLVVTKTVNITAPNAGDVITYTITVANNGPDEATGVQVIDVLPKEVVFDGHTTTRGTYITATGLWSVGNLVNATSATMTIAATVISCTGHPTIPNTASISAAWPNDPDPENNASRAVITPTSGVYCLYLPIIFKDYEPLICNPYDFNDSPGGWPVDNEAKVRTGYTENYEEYYIQRGKPGMRIVQAPLDYSNQYTVEVDAHWGDAGYEYGLIFGQSAFPVPTYAFGIGPDPDDSTKYRYRLYRILTYDRSNDRITIDCITQPCWISSSINPNSTNHLKVECHGKTIKLYVNGTPLPEHNNVPYSCAGQVGVFAQSSPSDPNAFAYFDNFKVSCPSQSSQAKPFSSQDTISPLSTMSIDLDWIE
jgi:uncharacterized repeat protein (TIGR01451 family)